MCECWDENGAGGAHRESELDEGCGSRCAAELATDAQASPAASAPAAQARCSSDQSHRSPACLEVVPAPHFGGVHARLIGARHKAVWLAAVGALNVPAGALVLLCWGRKCWPSLGRQTVTCKHTKLASTLQQRYRRTPASVAYAAAYRAALPWEGIQEMNVTNRMPTTMAPLAFLAIRTVISMPPAMPSHMVAERITPALPHAYESAATGRWASSRGDCTCWHVDGSWYA